jgi:ubiquinone/menaquinone biosynthesis C-methylase UbiE
LNGRIDVDPHTDSEEPAKMINKKISDILLELVPLRGKRIIDVGCGDGALVRAMAAQGARVTGLEINPDQLAKARASAAVADETYREGIAQTLPMKDASVDVVVFSNSLHHVPIEGQGQALAEAARVLVPGGMLFITEPLAEGAHFAVGRLIHDETVDRAMALTAIRAADQWALESIREIIHVEQIRFADFEAFHQRQIAVAPARAAVLEERQGELRTAFEHHGRKAEDGWWFEQPMRINLLRKA